MKNKELKKGDILEYSYSVFNYPSGDKTEIDRDMVMISTDQVLAFGGRFSFDVKDFKILRVWRENDDSDYVVIYDEKEVVD